MLTCGSAPKEDVMRLRGLLASLARGHEFCQYPSTVPGHVYFSIRISMSCLGAVTDAAEAVGVWHDDAIARDPRIRVASDTLMFSQFAGDEAREASRMLFVGDQRSLPAMQRYYPIVFTT